MSIPVVKLPAAVNIVSNDNVSSEKRRSPPTVRVRRSFLQEILITVIKLEAINNSINEALKRINVKISKKSPQQCKGTKDPIQNENSGYILYVVAVVLLM
jgi:hypothetical protein